jgi:hypothetical protein
MTHESLLAEPTPPPTYLPENTEATIPAAAAIAASVVGARHETRLSVHTAHRHG